ncbi:MAG TPA: sulfotransferase domain-containing protein [Thermoanaerobaculia bacterium]|nr:sulfotransferase domain-containing protein [Thermoanaerobaculia bacterium]
MHPAIFVVSTGRCGTQWLARFFEQNLGTAATVTHEPLHSAWSPREMLGAKTPANLEANLREPIAEHLSEIREALRSGGYIECGHPMWSSLPFLIETFKPDVRIIHLVRHPVPTAWSWLTHRAYCEPLAPYLSEKVLLSPFDQGVAFCEYRDRWSAMSPYEKALYYWLEVNAFATRVQSQCDVPWMTVRFDHLFTAAAQRDLLRFVGASVDPIKTPGFVDELRFGCEIAVDPAQVEKHSSVMQLAARFGFNALSYDRAELEERYLPQVPR